MKLANTFILMMTLLMGCGGLLAEDVDPVGDSVPPDSSGKDASLADLFGRCGVPEFGTYIEKRLDEPEYLATLLREFNTVTVGEAMMWLHPRPGRYDFSRLDKKVKFAESHELTIFSHLLWYPLRHLPRWFVEPILKEDLGASYPQRAGPDSQVIRRAILDHRWTAAERQTAVAILEDYVSTVVGRYRGRVAAWVVVNEPISHRRPELVLGYSFWLAAIGPEYIEIALRTARTADPEARLYLNDFGTEGLGPKSDALYTLVKDLKSRGVPLDAVGMQMHIKLTGTTRADEVRTNIRRLAQLGLDVYITELDVAIEEPTTPAKLETQAERYREMVQVCLTEPSCKTLFIWGFTDKYSWIPKHTPGSGDALIFDRFYRPKPAYYAIREALADCE